VAERAGRRNTPNALYAGQMKKPKKMKKIDYLQNCLIRFGSYKIGAAELVDLLSVAKGLASTSAISAASGRDERATAARLRHLRMKGLIDSQYTKEGCKIHKLTKLGEKIILECLNQPTK
jgi:hypothetical protein